MPAIETWYEKPGAHQVALWRKARRLYDKLATTTAILRLRIELILVAINHANKYGVQITANQPGWIQSRADAMVALCNLAEKFGRSLDAAERGILFIRPKGDADLDIVSAVQMNDEGFAYYSPLPDDYPPEPPTLGIAPLLLAGIIAAVVIGGIITALATSETLANKWSRDVELAQLEADKKLCENPQSEVCKTWLDKKNEKPIRKAKGAIDYLLGAGAGTKIAGGLALAIAAGVALWFWSRTPVRRAY